MAKADTIEQDDYPDLQRLLWCGEVMPTPTLIYWMKRLPHVRFTNLYGPTETTIASSHYTLESVPDAEHDAIPIGRACEGEQLHVLNDDCRPVAPGVTGHLYISGAGLSQGYWRDPGLTERAFVADPQFPGGRLYRTGDLARMDANGLVYFLGRRDSQIKSRGYRIELGEIEAALSALPYLRESAVIGVETDGFEGTSVCCAYVPTPTTDSSPQVIRRDLARMLPAYMLPAHWKAYERLPTNANGKIDRRAISERFVGEIREGSGLTRV
jgi:acyl-coenzyme A synthetase/AMP-(fatty) acid ligase